MKSRMLLAFLGLVALTGALGMSARSSPLSVGSPVLAVFPGAEGFGTMTPAGSGRHLIPACTTVYKVTNLATYGSGSLRACIDASGPRVCVFEVSGTIAVNDRLWIRNPYITIAGQTAPSPGITLKGATLTIRTHDVLVQHLRIRVGDGPGHTPEDRDGISISNGEGSSSVYNVVIDHCSVSWAIDGNIDLWGEGIRDVTISNSIVSEALHDSLHPEGPHSTGLLTGGHIQGVSVHHSLFAHNGSRLPRAVEDTRTELVNNVLYNWGRAATTFAGESPESLFCNVIGNYYKVGADSYQPLPIIITADVDPQSKFYVKGNIGPGRESDAQDEWDIVYVKGDEATYRSSTPLVTSVVLSTVSALEAFDSVLDNAGARPADRDAVDERVVQDVRDGTGRIIDSQDEVGGWPALVENRRALTLPPNPNGDDDGDGYTNLEEWLHTFSAEVESFNIVVWPPSQVIDPGGVATYAIAIRAASGFSRTVMLSVVDRAPDLTSGLVPTLLDLGEQATLTLTDTRSRAMPGLWYAVPIVGTDGIVTKTVTAGLLVGGSRSYLPAVYTRY